MRHAALAVLALCAAPLAAQDRPAVLPAGVEAISFLGDTLRTPAPGGAAGERMAAQLRDAEAEAAARPGDADALVWVGRRLGYLGRYRDAIDAFGRGIAAHPQDARFLRHRGHRWLTIRQLDLAVADLERAAELVRGRPDEVEPDGMPNARNVPTSTLQSNVWYHLALAHYLRGDFARALDGWREAMTVSTNPDMQVATSHWLYMTLRRLGRDAEAAAVLAPITADMDIIENGAYHRLLLLYKGELRPEALLGEEGNALDPAVGYGVGNWHLYEGRPGEARRIFERVVAEAPWAAFGTIAAEAELARLR